MDETTPHPAVPDQAITFPSGGRMPLLGFGTWQIKGVEATRATETALEAGYRHVDTATIYDNEAEVGKALAALARDEVFVTTKCPPARVGRERATLEQSLERLGLEQVDLWLVHWPGEDEAWRRMWPAFVEAREAGLARDIGVSNFPADLIDEITADTAVRPVVDQIKWSPLLYRPQVAEQLRERDVALEGYSALRGGTLEDPTIGDIAARLGRTPAQVIVRWHLQHGFVAIPKSRDPERIRSNADVAGFELSASDMAALDALGG
jgi:2,5-diketo-D-gluconate reductase A